MCKRESASSSKHCGTRLSSLFILALALHCASSILCIQKESKKERQEGRKKEKKRRETEKEKVEKGEAKKMLGRKERETLKENKNALFRGKNKVFFPMKNKERKGAKNK